MQRILLRLGVVLLVAANGTTAGFVVWRERAIHQQVLALTGSVSEQLTAANGTIATFETDLLALQKQQQELTATTVRPSTTKTVQVAAAPEPVKPESAAATVTPAKTPTGRQLVNINTASTAELVELPGIGQAYADRIVAGRPYQTVDQLDQVKGIGEKTLEKLRPLVTVQ